MDAYKHNPHQALFQDTFGDPERAASHLREVLPAALGSTWRFFSTATPGGRSRISQPLSAGYRPRNGRRKNLGLRWAR